MRIYAGSAAQPVVLALREKSSNTVIVYRAGCRSQDTKILFMRVAIACAHVRTDPDFHRALRAPLLRAILSEYLFLARSTSLPRYVAAQKSIIRSELKAKRVSL